MPIKTVVVSTCEQCGLAWSCTCNGPQAKTAADLDRRWARNFNASQQRLQLKERAVAYLGGKCKGCGYDKCPAAMDFHHPNPREKDFVISGKTNWDVVRAELDKTLLLCSNCHRETHAGLHPRFLDTDIAWD